MNRRSALLITGLAAAATIATAQPASAQPLCFGPSAFFLCVDPTGGGSINECIYVGPPPCIPVSAPLPRVYCGSTDPSICA